MDTQKKFEQLEKLWDELVPEMYRAACRLHPGGDFDTTPTYIFKDEIVFMDRRNYEYRIEPKHIGMSDAELDAEREARLAYEKAERDRAWKAERDAEQAKERLQLVRLLKKHGAPESWEAA